MSWQGEAGKTDLMIFEQWLSRQELVSITSLCTLPASRILLRNSLRCSGANSLAELIGRARPLSGSVGSAVSTLLMSHTKSWFQAMSFLPEMTATIR